MSEATGYIPRDYDAVPLGRVAFCAPFDLPPIPRNEWKDRIDYLEEQKATLWHIIQSHKLPSSDQNGYGYCWAHGTVNAMRVLRAKEGQPYKDLSATAVAAQIKNYRDEGGNTFEAIPFVAEHGVPTLAEWPENQVNRQYVTEAMKDEAATNRLTEWYEAEPNNEEQKATAILSGLPVVSGYSNIGHMMCSVRMMYRQSRGGIEFGCLDWNSWKSKPWYERWGKDFRSFDQAIPRVVRVA